MSRMARPQSGVRIASTCDKRRALAVSRTDKLPSVSRVRSASNGSDARIEAQKAGSSSAAPRACVTIRRCRQARSARSGALVRKCVQVRAFAAIRIDLSDDLAACRKSAAPPGRNPLRCRWCHCRSRILSSACTVQWSRQNHERLPAPLRYCSSSRSRADSRSAPIRPAHAAGTRASQKSFRTQDRPQFHPYSATAYRSDANRMSDHLSSRVAHRFLT